MRTVLQVFVCFAFVSIFSPGAQAEWNYFFSEVGDGNGLLDVSMGDERSACAVGMHQPGGSGSNPEPLVLCTSDGGASFRASGLGSGGLVVPMAVDMVDASTGFLTSFEFANFVIQSRVYRTDDGGRNWVPQDLPGPPQAELSDIFFLDANTGWTAGEAGVFYTVDGGTNWQASSLPDLGSDRSVQGLHFADAQRGWAVGGFPGQEAEDEWSDPVPACCGFVLVTSDGGQSWQFDDDGHAGALHRVWFADAQLGWAVGGGQAGLIVHTADGGQSWNPQTVPAGSYAAADYLTDVAFVDAQTGWALGNVGEGNPMVLTTDDGGQLWQIDASYDAAFEGLSGFEAFARYSMLLALSFPLNGRGMVCGKNAVVVGFSGGAFCADADGDGYQDQACGGDDCDDHNAYVSPSTEELCNGLDENCDGIPDEDFDFDRDPSHCGSCGFNCQPAQVCWDASCTMECPNELTRCGQECVVLDQNPDHCGACDAGCTYANAEGTCQAGTCQMGACLAGYFDLDRDAGNGCEYACNAGGSETCNGVDDDCDGQVDEDLVDCGAIPDGGVNDGGTGTDAGPDLREPDGSGGCKHFPGGGLTGLLILFGLGLLRKTRILFS